MALKSVGDRGIRDACGGVVWSMAFVADSATSLWGSVRPKWPLCAPKRRCPSRTATIPLKTVVDMRN